MAQHLLHMAKYGNKPVPPEPKNKTHRAAVAFDADMSNSDESEANENMPRLEDMTDSESNSECEWETDKEDNAACMASIADGIKKGQHMHTKAVVHTPTSWYNLMHTGQVLSEVTDKQSKVHFNINSKIKLGTKLSLSNLAALEAACLSCKACKQTKMDAPCATHTKGHAHLSFGTMHSKAAHQSD